MVVDPAYDGDYTVEETLVVHAVLAVEVGSLGIVAAVEIKGVNHRILIAEEAPYAALLLFLLLLVHGFQLHKALVGELLILFLKGFGDHKLCLAVLPGILPRLFSGHAMFLHGLCHLESGIDENAVEAIEQFGVHATHRRADDQVGLLFLCFLAQESQAVGGMEWDVVGDYGGIGEGFSMCVRYFFS